MMKRAAPRPRCARIAGPLIDLILRIDKINVCTLSAQLPLGIARADSRKGLDAMRKFSGRYHRPMPSPWTPDEDAKLADMVKLGVTCDAWPIQFPTRRFAEVAERRLDLVEAGVARHAPLL